LQISIFIYISSFRARVPNPAAKEGQSPAEFYRVQTQLNTHEPVNHGIKD